MTPPATPCLIVDAETVRRNIRQMQGYANKHSLQLRPHTKTHKSVRVGKMQMDAGACGLTVAKAGEARVMAAATPNILMAYPPVTYERCELLAQLARDARLQVALDSALAAERLDEAARQADARIEVLVDVDVGYGRTGVACDDAAVELAHTVDRLVSLDLHGIMIYSGHITGSAEQQVALMQHLQTRLQALTDRWDSAGLCRNVISSGSTPSAAYSHHASLVTEIRPGTYVYNDMNIVRGGYGTDGQCAARVHSTVISANVKGQVVLDAGSKTLTSDTCGPAPDSGYGHIVEYPHAKIFRLTEEHGQVDVTACDPMPKLGERVTVIPNHICVCINMQNQIWWREPETEAVSLPVDARGLLV